MARTPVGAGWYGVALEGVDAADSSGPLGAFGLITRRPRAPVYFVQSRTRGILFLSLAVAITGQRRIVLLEFIRQNRSGLRGLIDFLYVRLLIAGCRGVHVLTSWEVDMYSQRYRIDPKRIHCVLWPLSDDRVVDSSRARELQCSTVELPADFVMVSGRAACDWKTVVEAREYSELSWDLVIVCSVDEAPLVRGLTRSMSGVVVLCDIPPEHHKELVKAATVYALVLKEEHRSSGHIRLMESIVCRTPVVASDSAGLHGYAIDGCTARLVPVGDARALASAVDVLMTNARGRNDLVESATKFSEQRTFSRYLDAIRNLADAQ